MHEPYDDEDDYDENDSHDYPHDPYKWYYKFDIGPNTPISKWITDMFSNFWQPLDQSMFDKINIEWGNTIPGFPAKKLPVNSWKLSAGKSNSFQYLGANYDGHQIWKKKYFVNNPLNSEYIKHLNANAVHFLRQPHYYKGMFDIMN